MLEFLKKRLYNEKGSIDNVIMTLLMVIFVVVGVIGFATWTSKNKEFVERQATAEIEYLLERDVPAAGE